MNTECSRCLCSTFCKEKNWQDEFMCDEFMELELNETEFANWQEFSYKYFCDTSLDTMEDETDILE